jgi:NDP-sugar pyrophosphorylase family protein
VNDNRETTIVLNGDVLTDLVIGNVIEFHREKKADATIVLAPVENPAAFGLVETDIGNRVRSFIEKPKPEDLASLKTNNINAGIYVLEPNVLDVIPEGKNYSFEHNVFPDLLARDKAFYAFVLSGFYWRDIGNPESYLQGHQDYFSGRFGGFDIEPSDKSEVATAAVVDSNSLLGQGCVIKPNARILNSALGVGVHVEEHALIENSVIWAHTRVSSGAEIRDSIVGRSCHVGRNVSIRAGAVLGDKTSLTDYTKV